jgi:hypothetical protein
MPILISVCHFLADCKESLYLTTQKVRMKAMSDIEIFYENSRPFLKYLRSQNLDNLRKTKLRLRDKHAILPHVRSSLRL